MKNILEQIDAMPNGKTLSAEIFELDDADYLFKTDDLKQLAADFRAAAAALEQLAMKDWRKIGTRQVYARNRLASLKTGREKR